MASSASRRASLLAAIGMTAAEDKPAKAKEAEPAPSLGEKTPSKAKRLPSIEESPDRAALADSPSTTVDTSHLPTDLQTLITTFECLLTSRSLLRRRGDKCTFQNLASCVERMTGRQFKLQHLQQIKHVYPDAFDWQYIRLPSVQDPSRLEYQLLMSFDTLVSGLAGNVTPGNDSAAGRVRDSAARVAFKQKLLAWHEEHTAAAADGILPAVPTAPLPSKENAIRVGGSPSVSRSLGASMGRAASASSPTAAAPPASQTAAQQFTALPPPQQLPPRSPAMSRLLSAGARAGLPPPSPTRSGRPPPSPASQGPRGSLLTRGASGSILDAATSLPQQTNHTTAFSPVPASPTSHLKRKASSIESPTAAAGAQAAPTDTSPASTARAEPRRRRLMMGDSPTSAAAPASAAAADAATPTRRAVVPEDADVSPRIRAALEDAAEEERVTQDAARRAAAAATTPTGAAAPSGARGPSPSSTRSRNSLLARFMSEESMQELRRNSESVPLAAAQAEAAAKMHTQRLLPAAMDLIRAIYGPKGPVVKPKEEVVELMRQKSSVNSGMSSAEARLALDMMVTHAPEYAAMEEQNGQVVFRINRTVSIKTVRDKLKEVAAAAGSAPGAPSSTGA